VDVNGLGAKKTTRSFVPQWETWRNGVGDATPTLDVKSAAKGEDQTRKDLGKLHNAESPLKRPSGAGFVKKEWVEQTRSPVGRTIRCNGGPIFGRTREGDRGSNFMVDGRKARLAPIENGGALKLHVRMSGSSEKGRKSWGRLETRQPHRRPYRIESRRASLLGKLKSACVSTSAEGVAKGETVRQLEA